MEITLRVALGEEVGVEGPVATERIGYRFFLQPPSISATVTAIDGVDAVSDHPGVDTITVHHGPGSNPTGKMDRVITLWRLSGRPLTTTTCKR